MCWEKKTHLSKGLCGSEPYIAPELFDQKGQSRFKPSKLRHCYSSSSTSTSSVKLRSLRMPAIVRYSNPIRAISQSLVKSASHRRGDLQLKPRDPDCQEHSLTSTEYDARLVDVWAAAIVFYCMQFQELPWRVAKPSDPTFATYLSQYGATKPDGTPTTAPPLNNLVPRECRNVIRHMLDPDPKARWGVDEALKDKWLMGVQVCEEGVESGHRHVTAGMEVVKL